MLDPSRQLPNFFLLGAMRAGTASLAHYLQQHPAIHFTEPRDPCFFQSEPLYQRGLNYYLRTFCRNIHGRPWRGESSSTYFAHPHIVGPRLRSHYGDAPLKFVVLLREPVSRAWSHYLFRVQHGDEERDFASALAQETETRLTSETRYFAEGCYVRLLEEWQSYYPLENFLLLLSEDLAADPLAQVQRVFTWFGVDTTVPVNVNLRLNRSGYEQSIEMVRFLNDAPSWLRTIGERIWPTLWRRRQMRPSDGFRDRPGTIYGKLPELDPHISVELRKAYQGEVLALSKLLGRYLSHWMPHDELLEKSMARVSR